MGSSTDPKTCGSCRETKPVEEFDWKIRAKGIRQSRCRPCARAGSKAHYEANKGAYLDKAAVHNEAYRERNRALVRQALADGACSLCEAPHSEASPLAFYAGSKDDGQAVWMAVGSALSEAALLEAMGRSTIVCKPCLADFHLLAIEDWQHMTSEQRKAITAKRLAEGSTPKRAWNNYRGIEMAPADGGAREGA